jgi:hypothetical protein
VIFKSTLLKFNQEVEMRLFAIILCAFCFTCSKGKPDQKKDLPKDSIGIMDNVKDSLKDVKVSDVEAKLKKEKIKK